MMIPAIGAKLSSYKSKINHVNNTNVPFGFGLDYGDDDYLDANSYVHKPGNGNIFGYLKLIGVFFVEVVKEQFGFVDYEDNYGPDDDDDDSVHFDDINNIDSGSIHIYSP